MKILLSLVLLTFSSSGLGSFQLGIGDTLKTDSGQLQIKKEITNLDTIKDSAKHTVDNINSIASIIDTASFRISDSIESLKMEESYKSEIYSFIGALVVFILGAFLNEIKHRQRKAESDREANKKEAQQAKIESDKILKLIVYEFKKNYTLLNTISDFLDPKTKNQVIIPTFKLQIMFHEQISENNKLIIEEGELVNEINDVYYEIRHIQNRLDRVEELYKQSKSYMGSPNVPKNTMQHEIQGLKLLSDNNIEPLKNLHNKLANQLGMEIISNSQQSTRQTKYNSDDTIQSGSLDPSEPD